MTSEEKKRIIAAATEGPWEIEPKDIGDEDFVYIHTEIYSGDYLVATTDKEGYIGPHDVLNNDTAFIAAARTEWPKDFERVQKLESYLRDTQYHQEYAGARYRCKSCGRFKDQGCTADCELDALLREGR